jgi:hypothetical protein
MDSSINRILHQHIVYENMDAEEATQATLHELPQNEIFRLVEPLLHDRAKRIYRNHTRSIEDSVFAGAPLKQHHVNEEGKTVTVEEPINWSDAQKQLLGRSFSLPDGRWVTYFDSTSNDHRMRATWQRGRADSIMEDANRHEKLAMLMDEEDAEKLGDIDPDKWLPIVNLITPDN